MLWKMVFDIHKGTVPSIVCHTLGGVYFCIIVFILMETASGFVHNYNNIQIK